MITGAGWTEIGCEPDLDVQENWYFEFLQSSPALARDGDTLTLTGDVTEIGYLDREVAMPDRDLVGPLWTVNTIIDGDTAGNANWSEPATLQFTQDGEVEVTTGCNMGAGGYAVDGDEITFDEVAVTEKGCADETHQMLEVGVLLVIHHDGPVTFEIDADRLRLEIRGAGLGLKAD